MAQYYTGPHFWDRRTYEVTVKTTKCKNRKEWIAKMFEWADQRNMKMEWMGESTHNVDNDEWHEAHFFIPNEKDRILFALTWS